jgi:hypothetical protein
MKARARWRVPGSGRGRVRRVSPAQISRRQRRRCGVTVTPPAATTAEEGGGIKVRGGNRKQIEGRKGRGGAEVYREDDGEVEEGGGGPWRPNSARNAGGRGWGNEVIGGDLGRLESIHCRGLKKTTRRSSTWHRRDEGWPELARRWRGAHGGLGVSFHDLFLSWRGRKEERRDVGRKAEAWSRRR